MTRLLALTTIISLALTACGKEEPMDDTRTVQSVATEARRDIDALAAKVGRDPQVRQDTVTDCVPGRKGSGRMLDYVVAVTVDDDVATRLRGEIADELARDGWRVTVDSPTSVRFAKGEATMGVKLSQQGRSVATVGGSGGCVEES